MEQIAIIADDLTGASDTGVQFTQQGYKTMVIINPDCLSLVSHSKDVWSINTDTRRLNETEAYKSIYETGIKLREGGIARIYKKIDSTLRGHPGAELEALMDAWKASLALVVPAFPGNKRIVRDGILIINSEAEVAAASDCSEGVCYIPSVLKREMRSKVDLIELKKVRGGVQDLLQSITKAKNNAQVLVIDAVTDLDLQIIAGAISQLPEDTVIAGSAGLAAHLPLAWNLLSRNTAKVISEGTTLVLNGSRNPATLAQIQQLGKTYCTEPVLINMKNVIEGLIPEEIQRLLQEINSRLKIHGRSVIVTVDPCYQVPPEIAKAGQLIASTIGTMVSRLFDEDYITIKSLVMTGGDTAYHVCRALGAIGINLEAEILHGIPFGYLVGGRADGMPIVTKAGGFGTPDSLVKIVEYLITIIDNVRHEK